MDFLKKLKSPVALKSEPAQPQAQPGPEPSKAPPGQGPPVQASSRPQPRAAAPQAQPQAVQKPPQQAAQPRVLTQAPPSPVTQAAPPVTQHQPQAPVWAQAGAEAQRQPQARPPGSPPAIRMAPRVTTAQPRTQAPAPARAETRPVAQAPTPARPIAVAQQETPAPKAQPQAHTPKNGTAEIAAVGTKNAGAKVTEIRPTPGVYGPTGHLSSAPGFWRTVWAIHPNRTKRRLRKLLLSWEKLGAYISPSGTDQELTPAAETAFLRAKIDIARSVGYLKLLDGTGGIAREAGQKEAQFIELLERFPSLHSARTAGDVARRSLYYNWHLLYLFLHKMLGAGLYEAQDDAGAAALARRVETVIASGRGVSTGGRGAR